jgi:hypothetical protein
LARRSGSLAIAIINGTIFNDIMSPTVGEYSNGVVVTPRPENQTTELAEHDPVTALEALDPQNVLRLEIA